METKLEESRLRADMAPGILTAEGFLGADGRSLAEIIATDEASFRELGLDFDEVAEGLARIKRAGEIGLGDLMTLESRWTVRVDDTRGLLPCPWGDGMYHKDRAELGMLGSTERLFYSELSLHLLKAHHFCQGRSGTYRLEPSVLKFLLRP